MFQNIGKNIMVKKLVGISLLCMSLSLVGAQAPKKKAEPVWLKPINPENVPLLITFIWQENKVEMYGLTQEWIKESDVLRERAKNSLIFVTHEVIQKIKNGLVSPNVFGATCSFVLDAQGTVQEYDKKGAHAKYFLLSLGVVNTSETTKPEHPAAVVKKDTTSAQVGEAAYAKK
jgi:hypothetical protein